MALDSGTSAPELSVRAPRGALACWGRSPCQPLRRRPHSLCCVSTVVLQWSLCSGQRRRPCALGGHLCANARPRPRPQYRPPAPGALASDQAVPARPGPTRRPPVALCRGACGSPSPAHGSRTSPRSSGVQTDHPPGLRPLLTLHVCACGCSTRDSGPRAKFHDGV